METDNKQMESALAALKNAAASSAESRIASRNASRSALHASYLVEIVSEGPSVRRQIPHSELVQELLSLLAECQSQADIACSASISTTRGISVMSEILK